MAKLSIAPGSTDVTVLVKINDLSAADNSGKTGLAYNTADLVCYYVRPGGAATKLTASTSGLATLAAVDSAHSDGGFIEVSSAYMPGIYRLDLPDAVCAAGARSAVVTLKGAADMVQCDLEIDLNTQVNVAQWSGTNVATPATAGYPAVTLKSGTGTGEVSLSSGGVSLSTNGLNAAADAVWDEDITTHRATNSAGAVMQPMHSGTCQAGGSTTTIVLASGASSTDDYYNDDLIVGWVTADGTNKFADFITDYTGSTRTATVTGIPVSPGATYSYVILPGGSVPGASAPTAAQVADAVWDEALADHVTASTFGQALAGEVTRAGTAQAGTTSSITLDSGASSTNNLYRYHRVELVGGTGAGQVSYGTAYTGSSKVLTVDPPFAVAPSSDTIFVLRKMGLDAATPGQVADAVWDETRAGHTTAGTFGEYVNADTLRISGDATAADNLEAAYDGAGYAGGTIKPLVVLADAAHGGSAATLSLRRAVIANTTNDETALNISASGTGNAHAVNILASGGGKGVAIGAASVGMSIDSSAADAVQIQGGTNSDGLQISGNGSGVDIRADITGDLTGSVSGSVGSVTGAVGSVTAGVTLTNAGIDALFTRQLTESYAADGAAPTVAQALMLIQQTLGDFSISGTTLTVKKLDGSTTAATFTLNDGTAPTAITRAS